MSPAPRGYLGFLAANRRFAGFGFAMAMASSFGQTYFIGVFGPALRGEFGLSNTAWGSVYLLGTVASALLLPWSGRQVDRYDLRYYTFAVCALAAIACFLMASASGVVMLVLAVFCLRQAGQGLLSHVAVTAMARYFDATRGRALALTTLGFAAGEAILPILAVACIAALGWRWTYAAAGLLVVFGLVPLVAFLLRGHAEQHARFEAREAVAPAPGAELYRRSWTRAEVLRDTRFYLLLPGLMAPSFVITALFFHQLGLADAKGWSAAWVTLNYTVYAVLSVSVSLLCGPVIDRVGAVRLIPLMLLPVVAALVLVGLYDGHYLASVYLGLLGVSVGISHTAVAALWAELYGTRHLGGVRSMTASVSVFASALGPVTVGWFMDNGVTIEKICLLMAAYCAASSGLLAYALGRRFS